MLRQTSNTPRLGEVIAEAIDFLSSSEVVREEGPTGLGQPSRSIADLHAFRKRSGYYRANAVKGLDETIQSLAESDALVQSRVVETDEGYIAVWFDDQEVIMGVLIYRKNLKASESETTAI